MKTQSLYKTFKQGTNTMENSEYYLENDITVTKLEAMRELFNHGIEDASEFFNEYGIREDYKARDVLQWLGY